MELEQKNQHLLPVKANETKLKSQIGHNHEFK